MQLYNIGMNAASRLTDISIIQTLIGIQIHWNWKILDFGETDIQGVKKAPDTQKWFFFATEHDHYLWYWIITKNCLIFDTIILKEFDNFIWIWDFVTGFKGKKFPIFNLHSYKKNDIKYGNLYQGNYTQEVQRSAKSAEV